MHEVMKLISTQRLILRPHTIENAVKMNAWRNDTELNYYDDDGPELEAPVPLEKTQRYLERIAQFSEDTDIIRLAIHKKDDSLLIGFCMIAFIDKYNRRCKVGLTLGDKAQWGQGLGREVLEGLVGFCFEVLDMNRIGAEVFDFNERSLRLVRALGFTEEGRIRQAVLKGGQYRDEIIFGLLKCEWQE